MGVVKIGRGHLFSSQDTKICFILRMSVWIELIFCMLTVVLWNRVCLSCRPAVCLGVFLELDHKISLNFCMVIKTLMKLCVTELEFLEKSFFAPKIGEIGQK